MCTAHAHSKGIQVLSIADEVTDVSNRKQVVVCTRWADKKLNINVDDVELLYDILIRTVKH